MQNKWESWNYKKEKSMTKAYILFEMQQFQYGNNTHDFSLDFIQGSIGNNYKVCQHFIWKYSYIVSMIKMYR